MSKHQFAVHLAACLARLLVTQQDAVGLATLDSHLRQVIPPRGTTSHLAAINSALSQSQCGMETSLATALGQAAPQLRRRGMLILISDCFDDVDQLVSGLRFYRHMHNEVIVFQIWDQDELDFPFRSRTQFRSLETAGLNKLVDPRAVRETYLQRLASYRQQLTQALARERIDMVTCTTDQDLGELLSAYLSRREGRGAQRVKGQAAT